MDFITSLARASRQHDSIMVVVEKLTKVEGFILVKCTYSVSDVTQVFIIDVVRLHGVPKNFISDRDVELTSRFWKELFAGLRIEIVFIRAYHPQKYGKTKRVNNILEDMLRMYVMH